VNSNNTPTLQESTQGLIPYILQSLFYFAMLILIYQFIGLINIWKHNPVVSTSVVGFVEACRFHNGEIEIEKNKTTCYYTSEVPKLHKNAIR
jgi:hypothetical protein